MSSSASTASLTAVPYVGTGVVVLAVVWGVAVVLMVSTAFLRGAKGFLPVVIFLLAAIITVSLIFTPRTSLSTTVDINIYDYYFIARVTLLSCLAFFVIVGLLCVYSEHAAKMVRAKSIKQKYL